MALLKDLDDFDANGKVGDWCFLNSDTLIAIQLTDEKFTGTAILPIGPQAVPSPAMWQWDGNRESPTLSPSILHWGNGKDKPATWHGYLRGGKLESA